MTFLFCYADRQFGTPWLDSGVFGMALSGKNADGYRTLYFYKWPLSEDYKVSTKILRNSTIANLSRENKIYQRIGSRGKRTMLESPSYLDQHTKTLFFSAPDEYAVKCWNTKNKEINENSTVIVAQDEENMVFPRDIKVDAKGTVWVLTHEMPRSNKSLLQDVRSELRFGIYYYPADDLTSYTICDPRAEPISKRR